MTAAARRPPRPCLGRLFGVVRLNLFRAARGSKGADYLAGGLALGAFWVWTPVMLLHFPIAFALAKWLRVSKLAALAAVCVSNPVTIAPLQAVNFLIGAALTPGGNPASPYRHPLDLLREPANILQTSLHDYFTLCLGSLVTGTLTALVAWTLASRWAVSVSRRRQRRHALAAQRIVAAQTAHHGPREDRP